MSRIKILFTLFFTCAVVNGQSRPCTTPNNARGQCKEVSSCEPLNALLNNPMRSPQDLDTLRRSHCGFNGNKPLVCCPEPTVTNQCMTPEGKPGRCIGIRSCKNLISQMDPLSNELIQFIAKSRCNGPEPNSICCGPIPKFSRIVASDCPSQVTAMPPDPKTECCGVEATVGNKIIGGSRTGVDQYPWAALIEYSSTGTVETSCGAVLISARYALTAAHCVTGRLPFGKPTSVRLGEYDTSNNGPDCIRVEGNGTDCTKGIVSIPVEKSMPHAQYEPRNPLKRHDIALIKMTRAAPFSEFIRPICLPTEDLSLKRGAFNLIAVGWGIDESGAKSNLKLDVELPYIPIAQCAPNTTIGDLWRGQLCAGGIRGRDSCRGDSGGPLMYENVRQYEVHGIVSVGAVPCGSANIPGVYTNVYEYVTWIKNNIEP